MTITDLPLPTTRPSVSPSQLGQADLCMARLDPRLQAHPLYDDTASEQASFGNVVHAFIEATLVTGQALDLGDEAWVQDAIRWTLAGRREPLDWYDMHRSDLRRRQWADEVVTGYTTWLGQVLNAPDTLVFGPTSLVEERLDWELTEADGFEWRLSGIPDLLTPGVGGYDWKTASKPWKKGQSKVDKSDQLSVYTALAWYEGLYDAGATMPWTLFVYDRKGQEWESYETTRSVGQVESSVAALEALARTKGAGVYTPRRTTSVWGEVQRGWWCSAKWCDAWEACPYRDIGDGKHNDQRKVIWR